MRGKRWPALALLTLPPLPAMTDPLTDAETRFGALQSYQVTLRSTHGAGGQEVIRYFFCKPGWVRMEFDQPHRGAMLVYAPDNRRVRLWPFGLGHWPALDLAPDHPLLHNPHGHRVDRSNVGVLLGNMLALRQRGSMSPPDAAEWAGRLATALDITGPAGGSAGAVQRYRVWLARDTLFPLRVDSFAANAGLLESVDMGDAQIDVQFPERFFTP